MIREAPGIAILVGQLEIDRFVQRFSHLYTIMPALDIRKLPSVLTAGFSWLAALMTAAALGVHLATYGPDQLGPPLMNFALALFPAMFLIFGPVIVVVGLTRIPQDRLFTGLPAYVYVVGFAVVIYVFVDFFAMIQLLPGQPEQDGANYYFNNKGSLVPIGADTYRMGLMHAARLFSGHEIIFFGISALIAHQIDAIRRGRITLDLVPRDDAMERSRLPYPLQRFVTLRTTQSPETFAQNLLTPALPRSFFDSIRGLRGEASATGFRVELAGGQSQMVYAAGRLEIDRAGTSVQVLLTFKRWPLIVLGGSAILIPLAWAVMDFFGFQMPWFVVAFVVVFGVVGNFLFGLDQRRRLLAQIKRATDAREVSAP